MEEWKKIWWKWSQMPQNGSHKFETKMLFFCCCWMYFFGIEFLIINHFLNKVCVSKIEINKNKWNEKWNGAHLYINIWFILAFFFFHVTWFSFFPNKKKQNISYWLKWNKPFFSLFQSIVLGIGYHIWTLCRNGV